MSARAQRSERRTDALSRERIVATAIEILDAEGERGLTFRALAARLRTGPGAIYHHVANKEELLTAVTDDVIAGAVAGDAIPGRPQEAIRAIALGVFDAIEAHPWVGAQLAGAPWQPAVLRIFEGFGQQVQSLHVPEPAQFDAASALLNYLLGLAGQHAAGARAARGLGRAGFLEALVEDWGSQDPAEYPFMHHIAARLRDHDDREQFLAGIDLILAGIAVRGTGPRERRSGDE